MESLLKAGANPDSSSKYGTPLQLAAANGCGGAIALLLKAGADVNIRNSFRLPLGVGGRRIGGVSLRPEVGEYFESEAGKLCETALQAASLNGFTAIAQQLLDAGANADF